MTIARTNPSAGRRTLLRATTALLLAGGLPNRARAALDPSAIERAAADADLHSVLVWQGGRLLFEHYRRSKDKPVGDWFAREVTFGPAVLHDLRSISKSVVALLVGQAVARGQIDTATPVLDFYPALAELRRDGREAIRLSHLLDMASGGLYGRGLQLGADRADRGRAAAPDRRHGLIPAAHPPATLPSPYGHLPVVDAVGD